MRFLADISSGTPCFLVVLPSRDLLRQILQTLVYSIASIVNIYYRSRLNQRLLYMLYIVIVSESRASLKLVKRVSSKADNTGWSRSLLSVTKGGLLPLLVRSRVTQYLYSRYKAPALAEVLRCRRYVGCEF